MLSVPNLTVSISGIRGFCPTVLSPKVAYAIIRGYMDTLPTGTVVVSRDARPTGIELKKAVLQAIHDAGKTIVDIDLLPLPTTQIYIVHSHSVAGIDITASHNPPEYNGLKLLDNQGNFLSTTRLEEIL